MGEGGFDALAGRTIFVWGSGGAIIFIVTVNVRIEGEIRLFSMFVHN